MGLQTPPGVTWSGSRSCREAYRDALDGSKSERKTYSSVLTGDVRFAGQHNAKPALLDKQEVAGSIPARPTRTLFAQVTGFRRVEKLDVGASSNPYRKVLALHRAR